STVTQMPCILRLGIKIQTHTHTHTHTHAHTHTQTLTLTHTTHTLTHTHTRTHTHKHAHSHSQHSHSHSHTHLHCIPSLRVYGISHVSEGTSLLCSLCVRISPRSSTSTITTIPLHLTPAHSNLDQYQSGLVPIWTSTNLGQLRPAVILIFLDAS